MKIEGHVFLITGAASGLGAATARMLVGNGGKAVLLDIKAEPGAALATELGDAARFQCTDVTSEADGQAAVSTALSAFGRLDGLINCAGIASAERITGRDGPHRLESFVRTVSINLIGTSNMLRLAAAAIARQEPGEGAERGVIINTASIAAFDGQVGQAAYAASKAGVASLTLPAARELARFGIRVVSIAPGIFDTPMMAGLPQEARDALGASVPFPPRLGRAEEFAALVCHIIGNQMLNGAVIRLDGALRMAPH